MAVAPIRSALILAVTLLLAACGTGARSGVGPAHRGAHPDPDRARLDPQHQPHRPLRRAAGGLVRQAGLDVEFVPYNKTPPDTLVGSGGGRVRDQLPGLVHLREGQRGRRRVGDGDRAALDVADRGARRPGRHHEPQGPRRQDLRRLRRRVRGAEDAGRHQGRGWRRAVQHGGPRHRGVRGALRRAGRLHRAVRDVGGDRGRAARAPLKTFDYTDYGFPDAYNVLLIGNGAWLPAHPDQARAFVQAAQRGYEFAADDPAKAAELLEQANPGAFTEPELVSRSQQMFSERYLRDEVGRGRAADAREVVRVLGVPVRHGHAGRAGRQAVDGAAGLRDVVHRRVPGGA